MTITEFLEYWALSGNPFQGEEARNDPVFRRMMRGGPGGNPDGSANPFAAAFHSDFQKVLGDLSRPSSAIVFGEKGSGKTAMRLQIAARIAEHNQGRPGERVLLIAYDDLNALLDRFHEHAGGKTPLESFQKFRLADHLDGLLLTIVPRLVDAALGQGTPEEPIDLGGDARKALRKLDAAARRDLLLLQAVYDRAEQTTARTTALRRRLGLWRPWGQWAADALLIAGPIAIAAYLVYFGFLAPAEQRDSAWVRYGFFVLAGLFVLGLGKFFAFDRLITLAAGRRLRRQVRVGGRSEVSFSRSLRQLSAASRDPEQLPVTDSDEPRYAMLQRLRRVLRAFGYAGLVIVVDRIDEPTLISGDPDRMRAVVWPMLHNKFLQQEGVGVKMLLPIELRHSLFRESNAFFQEARLDKQHLVERLGWTGASLFDLCDARVRACADPSRGGGRAPAGLIDLFAEDVSRQDLVDALDQMHQPRDAFKFLYRCLVEHCQNVTRDDKQFRIPRHVLESVRRQESDRVQQLYRGIRPA